MRTKINITINFVPLEAEIVAEPPEPSNGYPGSYEIIALREARGFDIWPVIGDIPGVEEMIIAAIDKEAEKRREP